MRLSNPFKLLTAAILLSFSIATPVFAKDQTYHLYIGEEKFDGSFNGRMRLLLLNQGAEFFLSSTDEKGKTTYLLHGSLKNITEGILEGNVMKLDGSLLGRMSLREKIDEYNNIIWQGDIEGTENINVLASRSMDRDEDDISSNPLTVTDQYLKNSNNSNIPQDLFLHAKPKFERIREALDKLDAAFPYWRSSAYYGSILDGNFTIDYKETDVSNIGEIVKKLRESNLFEYVELSIAEYGGMPEQVIFSRSRYPFNDNKQLISIFKTLSDTIAEDHFCRNKCSLRAMSTKSKNVRAYELEGKSEDLHFNRPNHWEKYTVSFTIFSNDLFDLSDEGSFNIQFQIIEGYMAASGNGRLPPSARFKEHPIDSNELSLLSSKLQIQIANDLGAEYQEEF